MTCMGVRSEPPCLEVWSRLRRWFYAFNQAIQEGGQIQQVSTMQLTPNSRIST